MCNDNKSAGFLSRLFNNSGNKVDHTRVRLLDKTPINTTGITRLFHDNSVRAVAGMTALFGGIAYQYPVVGVMVLLGSTTCLASSRFFSELRLRNIFGKNYDDLCINKNPTPDTPFDMQHVADSYTMSRRSTIPTIISAAAGFTILSPGFTFAPIVNDCENMVTFAKVASGKYVIEDTPPPEKKPVKERRPLFEPEPSFA